jgi:hypothetical protein
LSDGIFGTFIFLIEIIKENNTTNLLQYTFEKKIIPKILLSKQ